jgi:hypothetical protein
VYQPVSIEPRVLVPKVVRAGQVESTDLMAAADAADDADTATETTE